MPRADRGVDRALGRELPGPGVLRLGSRPGDAGLEPRRRLLPAGRSRDLAGPRRTPGVALSRGCPVAALHLGLLDPRASRDRRAAADHPESAADALADHPVPCRHALHPGDRLRVHVADEGARRAPATARRRHRRADRHPQPARLRGPSRGCSGGGWCRHPAPVRPRPFQADQRPVRPRGGRWRPRRILPHRVGAAAGFRDLRSDGRRGIRLPPARTRPRRKPWPRPSSCAAPWLGSPYRNCRTSRSASASVWRCRSRAPMPRRRHADSMPCSAARMPHSIGPSATGVDGPSPPRTRCAGSPEAGYGAF